LLRFRNSVVRVWYHIVGTLSELLMAKTTRSREKVNFYDLMAERRALTEEMEWALFHGTVEELREVLVKLDGRRAVAPKRRAARDRRLKRLQEALDSRRPEAGVQDG
jgi:hypothetical protein